MDRTKPTRMNAEVERDVVAAADLELGAGRGGNRFNRSSLLAARGGQGRRPRLPRSRARPGAPCGSPADRRRVALAGAAGRRRGRPPAGPEPPAPAPRVDSDAQTAPGLGADGAATPAITASRETTLRGRGSSESTATKPEVIGRVVGTQIAVVAAVIGALPFEGATQSFTPTPTPARQSRVLPRGRRTSHRGARPARPLPAVRSSGGCRRRQRSGYAPPEPGPIAPEWRLGRPAAARRNLLQRGATPTTTWRPKAPISSGSSRPARVPGLMRWPAGCSFSVLRTPLN